MISAEQLVETLTGAGIPRECIQVFDEEFECVEPSWITGELRMAFEKALFEAGIVAREGQFDCNKLAKLATTVADLCWYQTGEAEGVLAFGMLGMIGHMLCIAVHQDQSGLWVAAYDPTPLLPAGWAVTDGTTMRERNVTREEYRECLSCIFV